MNELELRAYAVRGLTTRLAELDDERARILVLLAEWDTTAVPGTTRRARTGARPSKRVTGGPGTEVVDRGEPASPAIAPDRDVARVLPRRHRITALPDPEPVPTLPPMPRLVKARAS